jgi:DNA-binding transcriptional ArsR family regulator
MRSSDSLWTGDVNEVVIEEWKAETSPFERVREVLLTVTTFQYAGAIAEQAAVSESTARKHLSILAESGFAETETTGQGTRFKRSRETIAMQRIKELHTELSRDELVSGIHDLKSQIQSYQDQYDVTDPDELAVALEPDAEGWGAISDWRAVEADLKLAQAALSLYDFDPDVDERSSDGTTGGAFADETGLSV